MTLDEALEAIPRLSALVVGDVCLDRWCRYDPAFGEPSRETGIPRIAVTDVQCTPGAAGTVASNLAALGTGRVAVLGIIGDDGHGHELRRALQARGIEDGALITGSGLLTFTYTKLINGSTGTEDLPRVDFVLSRDVPAALDAELVQRFQHLAPQFDIVIVSDQAEIEVGGTVTPSVRDAVSRFATQNPARTVWVDSRARGERFHGTVLKLNQQEANESCARINTDYHGLRRHTGAPILIITRGGEGADIFTEHDTRTIPAHRIETPVDICGAGDSFNAAAALMLNLTGDPIAAATLGNLAASITIMKPGTGTASPEEIRKAARILPHRYVK